MDNDNTELLGLDDAIEEGSAFEAGYAKGKADERNRIALALKSVDDTWGMLFLSDLFENEPKKKSEPLRYGED